MLGSCWQFSDRAWDTDGGPSKGIPLTRSSKEVAAGFMGAHMLVGEGAKRASAILRAGKRAELLWARRDEGLLHRAPEAVESHSAFLLVTLEPGAGSKGAIEFRSCAPPTHMTVEGHRAIVFEPFPPKGVHVLAEHGHYKLLEIEPGAQFKIDRKGQLEGAPSFFRLQWNGNRWLTWAKPHRRLSDTVWL